ncbi:MAG TPA: DUF2721 domain-containing protein [Bryobacteraceae bacterium]|jgi:hypothetical protein
MGQLISLFTDLHLPFNTLAAALNVLAAMLTPVLLISATGTFILSTATRLGRVVDRMRIVSDRIVELAAGEKVPLRAERIDNYQIQLMKLNVRLMLLQKCVTTLYSASATFVLTSVAIGLAAIVSVKLYWIPVALGIGGACLLLWASIMLISEARLTVKSLQWESEFLRNIASRLADASKEPDAAEPAS